MHPGPRDNQERRGLGHREDIVEGSRGKVVQLCRDDGCRTCPHRPQGSELHRCRLRGRGDPRCNYCGCSSDRRICCSARAVLNTLQ